MRLFGVGADRFWGVLAVVRVGLVVRADPR